MEEVFCPRCGGYTAPKVTFCGGCGGQLQRLRQNSPAIGLLMGGGTPANELPRSFEGDDGEVATPSRRQSPPAPPAAAVVDFSSSPPPVPPSAMPAGDGGFDLDLGVSPSASAGDGVFDLDLGVPSPGATQLDAGPSFDLGEAAGGGPDAAIPTLAFDPSSMGVGDNVFDLDGGSPGGGTQSFDLDLSAPSGGSAIDLSAPAAGGNLSFDLDLSAPSPASAAPPADGVFDLDFSSPAAPAPAPAMDGVFDLDAGLDAVSSPMASAAGGGEIDFSALSTLGAPGGGALQSSDEVDFSSLSSLSQSQEGGDSLDLSLSNFGGDLGEVDFSAVSADLGAPPKDGDAIDFSGLSSIDVAPPPKRQTSSMGMSDSGSGTGEIVYDLDLSFTDAPAPGDLGIQSPQPVAGPGSDGEFVLDDQDGLLDDDLLKASLISYQPPK